MIVICEHDAGIQHPTAQNNSHPLFRPSGEFVAATEEAGLVASKAPNRRRIQARSKPGGHP